MRDCYATPEVHLLHDGELDARRAEHVRQHVRGCQRCANELRWLAHLDALGRDYAQRLREQAGNAAPRRERHLVVAVLAVMFAAVVTALALVASGGVR